MNIYASWALPLCKILGPHTITSLWGPFEDGKGMERLWCALPLYKNFGVSYHPNHNLKWVLPWANSKALLLLKKERTPAHPISVLKIMKTSEQLLGVNLPPQRAWAYPPKLGPGTQKQTPKGSHFNLSILSLPEIQDRHDPLISMCEWSQLTRAWSNHKVKSHYHSHNEDQSLLV